MNASEAGRAFVDRINAHDVEGIVALMTDDHEFLDASGASFRGKVVMKPAWQGYFAMITDYKIEITHEFANGDKVALFGVASGTVATHTALGGENAWRLPVAWLAVVREGKIAEWRVYSDTKPVFDIMDAAQRKTGAAP